MGCLAYNTSERVCNMERGRAEEGPHICSRQRTLSLRPLHRIPKPRNNGDATPSYSLRPVRPHFPWNQAHTSTSHRLWWNVTEAIDDMTRYDGSSSQQQAIFSIKVGQWGPELGYEKATVMPDLVGFKIFNCAFVHSFSSFSGEEARARRVS